MTAALRSCPVTCKRHDLHDALPDGELSAWMRPLAAWQRRIEPFRLRWFKHTFADIYLHLLATPHSPTTVIQLTLLSRVNEPLWTSQWPKVSR